MVTIWRVSYEWKTGRKWDKREDFYVGRDAYRCANDQARTMTASYYRNVKVDVVVAHARGDIE